MGNGGLFDGPVPFFCVLSFMAAAIVENKYEERVAQRKQLLWATPGAVPTSAGDFGFDPMGISKEEGRSRQKELRGAELYNGRLAMLAITGFAVQEFLWSKPVIEQTPFLLWPVDGRGVESALMPFDAAQRVVVSIIRVP